MSHVRWALVALVAYSFLPPLVKAAVDEIPSETALFIVNGTLILLLPVVVVASGRSVVPYLTHPKVPYLVGAGVALTVALVAFYRGLAAGPVSVVVPIFGLFLVGAPVVGVIFFEETVTARKVAAVATAVVAVYLASTG